MSIHEPDSPCQGYCTTYHGDTECKACFRTEREVFDWIMYDEAEKQAVREKIVIRKQ